MIVFSYRVYLSHFLNTVCVLINDWVILFGLSRSVYSGYLDIFTNEK